MSNLLGTLRSPKGATKNVKRIGRGQGSGHGGTSTKGHKGAQSRSGYKRMANFEGGQMSLIRRVPKFGFHNPFRVDYQEVNLGRLQRLVDDGVLSDGIVTPELLFELGITSKRNKPVKILGNGELKTKLAVTAHKLSAAARTKIEQAGGSVTINE